MCFQCFYIQCRTKPGKNAYIIYTTRQSLLGGPQSRNIWRAVHVAHSEREIHADFFVRKTEGKNTWKYSGNPGICGRIHGGEKIFPNNYLYIIQDKSLARGPKLLSMYTVEQRGFLVRKYWETCSFEACQTAFRTEFGERRAPSKCCIQKLVKKLETSGSRSNACRLLSLGPYWRAKCTEMHPSQSNNSKTLYAERFKTSTSTLWEKYSRIWRNTFQCAWMWKETIFSIDYDQVLFFIVPGICV